MSIRSRTRSIAGACVGLAMLAAFSGAMAQTGPNAGCYFPTMPRPTDYKAILDLAYKRSYGETVALDLYLPAAANHPPLILIIHGGGWAGGSKSQPIIAGDAKVLAGQGYAAATLDYRMVANGRNRFPAPVQDSRCAVRWLKANAKTYGYDGDRIGVLGFSAGAYLAAMLGTAANVRADFDDPSCGLENVSPSVAAVAAYYAPADFADLRDVSGKSRSIFANFLGADPSFNGALARRASPTSYVSRNTPPFFVAHGVQDNLVPVAQQRNLVAALRSADVPTEYIEVPDLGHGFQPFSPRQRTSVEASTCALMAFFQKTLR